MSGIEMKLYSLMYQIINRFIRVGKMILIEKDLKDACVEQSHISSVEYRWIDATHANEIVSLKHLSNIAVETFFHQGSRCLAAYTNNALIGYVWYHSQTYRWPFFDYIIDCSKKLYIGPSFVRVEFRGKRLHGALLCLMFNELYAQGYQNALSSVWTNNVSSIKGAVRVGFFPIRSIYAVRIMNVLVYKRLEVINQWP